MKKEAGVVGRALHAVEKWTAKGKESELRRRGKGNATRGSRRGGWKSRSGRTMCGKLVRRRNSERTDVEKGHGAEARKRSSETASTVASRLQSPG